MIIQINGNKYTHYVELRNSIYSIKIKVKGDTRGINTNIINSLVNLVNIMSNNISTKNIIVYIP